MINSILLFMRHSNSIPKWTSFYLKFSDCIPNWETFVREVLWFDALFSKWRNDKNLDQLSLSRPSGSHDFNAKIGLKNRPPWPEIFAKMLLNMARQTKPQPHFGFSQISRPRAVCFSNRFLHWNRGIETVVLSTMKGTNGVFKKRKILPTSLKNGLKNAKLREK